MTSSNVASSDSLHPEDAPRDHGKPIPTAARAVCSDEPMDTDDPALRTGGPLRRLIEQLQRMGILSPRQGLRPRPTLARTGRTGRGSELDLAARLVGQAHRPADGAPPPGTSPRTTWPTRSTLTPSCRRRKGPAAPRPCEGPPRQACLPVGQNARRSPGPVGGSADAMILDLGGGPEFEPARRTPTKEMLRRAIALKTAYVLVASLLNGQDPWRCVARRLDWQPAGGREDSRPGRRGRPPVGTVASARRPTESHGA